MKNKNQTEASREAETFSPQLMRAAFVDVQNRSDWKAPINSVCCVVNQELTRQAVIFFTGTEPTFEEMTPAEQATQFSGRRVRVKAAGYRNGPCGDTGLEILPTVAGATSSKKIEALAYDAGFENVGTEDLDPALVPDVDENWEIWNRGWKLGRADAQEEATQIIGGIINDLEWLNEMPDGDWIDGHGDTQNKAERVQHQVNKLRELVGFPFGKQSN
jgi:hypothetical protein